jgi:hypothetical protein
MFSATWLAQGGGRTGPATTARHRGQEFLQLTAGQAVTPGIQQFVGPLELPNRHRTLRADCRVQPAGRSVGPLRSDGVTGAMMGLGGPGMALGVGSLGGLWWAGIDSKTMDQACTVVDLPTRPRCGLVQRVGRWGTSCFGRLGSNRAAGAGAGQVLVLDPHEHMTLAARATAASVWGEQKVMCSGAPGSQDRLTGKPCQPHYAHSAQRRQRLPWLEPGPRCHRQDAVSWLADFTWQHHTSVPPGAASVKLLPRPRRQCGWAPFDS